MLLDDPLNGCFLCSPEDWRVLFSGQHVRIIAGAGPLCSGYVLVAPKSHIHTTAELDEPGFWEFEASFEILTSVLQNHYGPGYTAYEHGRVGACQILEAKEDFSTFCHHAHRVVIPRGSNCLEQIAPWFEQVHELGMPSSLRALAGKAYVYYESRQLGHPAVRLGFTGDRGIPSQFMRRTLTRALNTGRDWNWARDFNYEEMIDTVSRLRGEFIGLELQTDQEVRQPSLELRSNVSIDGFAYVGKTSLARCLSLYFHRPFLDTGMIFRYLVSSGLRDPSAVDLKELEDFLLDSQPNPSLKNTEVTNKTIAIARDPASRALYSELLKRLLQRLAPCIVVGRDTWRFMTDRDTRVVVEAAFETRLRRRLLWIARNEKRLPHTAELAGQIRVGDEADRIKIPPADAPGIIQISNDRHPLSATVARVLDKFGGYQ